jgi:excisionase family DNA binding protein
MDDYLTVTQAAAELGISVGALRTRLLRGHMHGQHAGPKLWLISREEVERAKREGRLRPGPKARRGEVSDEERNA